MNKQRLVMIGNGMAGVRLIEEVLKINKDIYDITIFGAEPHPNYNRIQLSNILQGKTHFEETIINEWEWYAENNIELFVGEAIINIDIEKQTVLSDKGLEVSYDKLVIATGSVPFILPVKGADKIGVIGFRDINDCEMMIKASKHYKKAVVIGGGLLGLEAAKGLMHLGMEVDVVHLMPHLMERQLDPVASGMLKSELEAQGMNFLMEKQTVEITGSDRVEGIRFKDGTETTTDLVVMAAGIKANIQVVNGTEIEVNRGIVVNDFMETNVDNVYAIGECAEHREVVYGLVAPLYEQGKVLAARLCGLETKAYEGSITGTQLKVSGIDLFSAGEIYDDSTTKPIIVQNYFEGVYKKVLIRENRIVGIVLYGDTRDSNRLFKMLNDKQDIADLTSIPFIQPNGAEETLSVEAMADDEIVCGCNGINKKEIVDAIQEHELTSVEAVGGCTNAGRSCGRCKPVIQDILAYTLGDSFDDAPKKKTLCGCTTLDRDEVVAEIKEKGLTSIKEVMNVLEWKQEEGCSKCRPALNYFLGMIHIDYIDERNSRLVNEKMHANIQKDGTYSVIPRMYGGVTSAEDLLTIANVAKKYNVPLVKLTGGQRIGLYGLKKEQLPDVWNDLGMPSGYAYGKTLRTVKTCVGSSFCRFGTQDSMSLGIELEKRFERLDTPHKVKMGVSACPRNCAESGIKDVGVVGLDGGWEIYVGGNGGTDLRAGDLLCKVATEKEVLDITGAYIQYYRETALYLERTSQWIERLGLDHVKELVADLEKVNALNSRLADTLNRYQEPWEQAINDEAIQNTYYRTREVTLEK
ncbi:nitrite reductase large subunit NirB [Bacillus suaedae]|uniref:Nitrite reductase large subunit NirB n=1 Tax=Halalkalibacter suaedae TaxID=2822140 RepID=A0A940WQU0_9BACI|nr:nitrite reductase large subunit NirB [Bacillus suaedae]MBP3950825.1 nitrite reductase large subunit NirB [Bacillus suaedae]